MRKATYFGADHSSTGGSTDLGSPLLFPASEFPFVARVRVENKRLLNAAAAHIIDEGRKKLKAKGAKPLVFLSKNLAAAARKEKNKTNLARQMEAEKSR